ncbi:MFS transporter [Pyronema omphalodes]|nr:MFS transporter [Pyronema omphalodes]
MEDESVPDRQPPPPKEGSNDEVKANNLLSLGSPEEDEYFDGIKLCVLVFGLSLIILIVALDTSIISTAIPTITSEFKSTTDIGWYGSAYLLTICSLQPLSGKIYSVFPKRSTFLLYLALFEIGSLVCATAPNSRALIAGRAIAGAGSAGLFSGAITIMADTIEMRKRAACLSVITSMYGIGTVAGPLIGGSLTEKVGWRWCFYINLPIGAITAFVICLVFNPPKQSASTKTLLQNILSLDLPGCAMFVSACIMLLLALQWGGNTYPWKSATILGLLLGSIPLIEGFILWERRKGAVAMIPSHIFMQRTVIAACFAMFLHMGGSLLIVYYLPIWLQVVRGDTPSQSGVMVLPTVISQISFSLLSSMLLQKVKYYNVWILLGLPITAVGNALMGTFTITSTPAQWIGYQIISGVGRGLVMQMPILAVQNALNSEEEAIGTGLIVFSQYFGGTVLVSLGQTAFVNLLSKFVYQYAPDVNPQMLIKAGLKVRGLIPAAQLENVLLAYNKAITGTFYVAVGTSALAIIPALAIEWKRVPQKKKLAQEEAGAELQVGPA